LTIAGVPPEANGQHPALRRRSNGDQEKADRRPFGKKTNRSETPRCKKGAAKEAFFGRSRRRATGRQSARKKRASKSVTVRRKERKVDEARRHLIEAEKELAVEELPKIVHPATTNGGADSHVPSRIKRKRPSNLKEQKLEQGLEESMAGSDPVSVTQPAVPIAEKSKNNAASRDDDSVLLERALASESQRGTAVAQRHPSWQIEQLNVSLISQCRWKNSGAANER
jgi:hypothetical protein